MSTDYDTKLVQQISDTAGVPADTVRKVLDAYYRLSKPEGHQLDASQLLDAVLIQKPTTPGYEQVVPLSTIFNESPESWHIAPSKVPDDALMPDVQALASKLMCVVKGVSAHGFDVLAMPSKEMLTIPHSEIGRYMLLTDLEGNSTTPTPDGD